MTRVQSTSPCLHALHCGHFVPRLAVLVCLRVEDLAQQALQPQFYYPDMVTTKRLDITFTTSHQVSQTLRICFLDIFSSHVTVAQHVHTASASSVTSVSCMRPAHGNKLEASVGDVVLHHHCIVSRHFYLFRQLSDGKLKREKRGSAQDIYSLDCF